MSDERVFTQEEVDRIIGRTRLEARDRAERDIKEELSIAKEHEAEIEALKEQVETHKSNYDTIMQASLESAISEFPEDTREMINNLPGDVSEKFAWAKKYKEILDIKPGDGVGNRSTPPAKPDLPKSDYHRRGIRKT